MTKPEGEAWHCVATRNELEDSEPFPVDVKGEELAIVQLGDDIYAINNICTHEYACLSDGYVEEDRIVCQLHLAEFHIPTGKAVEEPAVEDLKTYPVVVDGNDIYVKVD